MNRLKTTCLTAGSAILLLSCRTGGPAPPVVKQAEAVERDIPDVARNILTARMRGHADQMALLFWSVLFLDNQGAAQVAEAISNEPKLARPSSPSEDTINAMLPEQFFVLQDELARNARALIAVATAPDHDEAAIGRAYGDVATTCLKCHAQYMYGADDNRWGLGDALNERSRPAPDARIHASRTP